MAQGKRRKGHKNARAAARAAFACRDELALLAAGFQPTSNVAQTASLPGGSLRSTALSPSLDAPSVIPWSCCIVVYISTSSSSIKRTVAGPLHSSITS